MGGPVRRVCYEDNLNRDEFQGARLAVPLKRHGICYGKVQVDFTDRGRKSGENDDTHLRVKRVVSDVSVA